MKTLIASASRTTASLIRKACEGRGLEVVLMRDEQRLLEEVAAEHPGILFIQASILEASGQQVISRIKEDEILEGIQVVCTAGRPEWADFAHKSGADAFLPIPFSDEQIDAVLRGILEKPRRLLLVSGGDATTLALGRQLREAGFELLRAREGSQGLDLAGRIFPDLVLSSFRLADMDAQAFCRELRKNPVTRYLPLFVLLEEESATVVDACFELGVQDVLLPPFDSGANLERITTVVAPPRRRQGKALVVDDSGTVRTLVSRMFQQLGFVVTTAENGEEGLTKARAEKPDIITSDYDMPVLDGWGMCRELRRLEETLDIPIIMVTARNTEADVKKGQVLGVNAYLTKPFTVDDLKKQVGRTMAEQRQKREKAALSKYVASDAMKNVSDVVEGRKDLAPASKFISILFSDICSFTPKCERFSPMEIVAMLNAYFDVMIDAMKAHRAIIDKLIGDAIVARFDSGDRRTDALDAVRAARAMLEALDRFNAGSREVFEMRIGINSGEVILGNVGSSRHRLDYTMIGDNVNTAQRLESQAARKGCLISQPTYDLVRDLVEVGEGRDIALKGKARPVTAYPLLGVKE